MARYPSNFEVRLVKTKLANLVENQLISLFMIYESETQKKLEESLRAYRLKSPKLPVIDLAGSALQLKEKAL